VWEVEGSVRLSATTTRSPPPAGLNKEVQWFYISAEALSERMLPARLWVFTSSTKSRSVGFSSAGRYLTEVTETHHCKFC